MGLTRVVWGGSKGGEREGGEGEVVVGGGMSVQRSCAECSGVLPGFFFFFFFFFFFCFFVSLFFFLPPFLQ